MSNDEQFMAVLRSQFPDIYTIVDLIRRGHVSPQEVADVVHKMAIVRSSDDGFGKILLDMQQKDGEYFLRIRTIQDKVIRSVPEEDLI